MCLEIQICTYRHRHRRQVLPAYRPEFIRPNPHHLFDAVAQFFNPKQPRNCYSLEEADPQKRYTTGRVVIHQLEDVHPTLNKRTDSALDGIFQFKFTSQKRVIEFTHTHIQFCFCLSCV